MPPPSLAGPCHKQQWGTEGSKAERGRGGWVGGGAGSGDSRMPSEAARRPRQRHRKKQRRQGDDQRRNARGCVKDAAPSTGCRGVLRGETRRGKRGKQRRTDELKERRGGRGEEHSAERGARDLAGGGRVTSPTTMGVASGGALAVRGVTAGREGRTRRGGARGAFRTPSALPLPPPYLSCPPP